MNKVLRALAAAALLAAAWVGPVRADQDSFCLPTTGLVSGLQFAQAANDALKALATASSGPSEPSNDCSGAPVLGQTWLDTSSTPSVWKLYDGDAWIVVGTMDASGHRWVPPVGGGANSVASAATTSLWSVPEAHVTITGNTTITSFGAGGLTGTIKFVAFAGTPQITHNGTSLILPGGASVTAAAGDRAVIVSLGGANAAVIAYTRANGQPLVANSTFSSQVVFSGLITPAALAATTNDWAPAGLTTANTIRASASTSQTLTGIASQPMGTELTLLNVNASTTITLANESGGSSAGNRFAFGADVLLGPGAAVSLRYDGTTSRWVLAGLARNQATQAQALAGTDNTAVMTPLRTNQLVDQDVASATAYLGGLISSGDASTYASAQGYVLQGYRFLNHQYFSATGTWFRPAGVRLIRVYGCAAGGGGGGADAGDGDSAMAAPGGSAGQCTDFVLDVTGIAALSIGIGAPGGGGSSSGGNGGTGGAVTIGPYATLIGGNGGVGRSGSAYESSSGASGGTGGNLLIPGLLTQGGDGGGSLAVAGRTGDQNAALSGAGGASMFGGGGRSRGFVNDGTAAGDTGSSPGSGGSGGAAVNVTSGASGGSGGGGLIVIENFL